MKKLLLLLLIFYSCRAFAQTSTTTAFSFGAELAIPSYGLYSIGTGVSAKLELPVASSLSICITPGFTSAFYKSNLYATTAPGPDLFVPLKAGLKYYFNKGVYAEGEAGTAVELNHNKQNLFAFSVGVGFILPINDNHGVDISFRYEDWQGQLRQTALRFAYRFGR